MRILLAEHPSASGQSLARRIRALGHEVLEVHSGRDAIAAFLQKPFPLVVVDLGRSIPEGFELCRRLRALDVKGYVHVMVLTPSTSAPSRMEAEEAGIDDLIPSPVDLQSFQARLEVASALVHLYENLDILRGLVPLCAHCGQVQRKEGIWQPTEALDAAHGFTRLSHIVCPACRQVAGSGIPRVRGHLKGAMCRGDTSTWKGSGAPCHGCRRKGDTSWQRIRE